MVAVCKLKDGILLGYNKNNENIQKYKNFEETVLFLFLFNIIYTCIFN